MRDVAFRQRINAMCLEKRDTIVYFIEQFCEHLNVQLPGASADHALAILALMDGVLYFSIAMPNELPEASAEAVLINIFTRMFFSTSI